MLEVGGQNNNMHSTAVPYHQAATTGKPQVEEGKSDFCIIISTHYYTLVNKFQLGIQLPNRHCYRPAYPSLIIGRRLGKH